MADFTFRQLEKNQGIDTYNPSIGVSWSTGHNIRFRPGTVQKTLGRSAALITLSGNPSIRAIFPFKGTDGVTYYLVCTDFNVYAYKSVTTDLDTQILVAGLPITPSPAPAVSNSTWWFALVGTVPVLSNGAFIWCWLATNATLTLVSANSGATGTIPTNPKTLAGFKHRLFTGNITDTEDGVHSISRPSRLKYSSIANPWMMDASPNITGNSSFGRAGFRDLVNPESKTDQAETIMAMVSLNDILYVFTDRKVWTVTVTSGPIDFICSPITYENCGLAAPRLAVAVNRPEFDGVIFMGRNDFYVASGNGIKAMECPLRNAIFPNLNYGSIASSFAWNNIAGNEVLFCLPTGTNTSPDTAYVYNYELKNWSKMDCAYTAAVSGYAPATLPTSAYSGDISAWQNNGTQWVDSTDSGIMPRPFVGDSSGKIFKFDSSLDDAGGAISAFVESGDIGNGINKIRFINIIPDFKYGMGTQPVMVQVGARDSLDADIRWEQPQPFVPEVGQWKIDSRNPGRYLRIRFYSYNLGSAWILNGFSARTIDMGLR